MTGGDLRTRRLNLGMTQTELAERLGTSQQTVARWETGARNIERPETLALALTALEHEVAQDRA